MKTTIIFDFDGTIIDTNALIEEGLDVFAIAYRGSPLTKLEQNMLTGKPLLDQMAYINESRFEEMTDAFKLWYLSAHKKLAKAFDGINELLQFLSESNYRMAIVSNNSRDTILYGMNQLEIESYFEEIITCDDVVQKKPSPEGLNILLKRMGVTQEESIFIGDSSNDILASKRAGIDSVLVGWTSVDRKSFEEIEPEFIIEHPMELLQVIGLIRDISA